MHSLVAFSITGAIETFLETFSRFIVHIRIEVNTADEDNLVRYECYMYALQRTRQDTWMDA